MAASFVICCYISTIIILTLFALIAVRFTIKLNRVATTSTTVFITARGTQPALRVAWSFYASAIGAW